MGRGGYLSKLYVYALLMLALYMYIYSPALKGFSYGLDKIIFVVSVVYLLWTKQIKQGIQSFRREFRYLFGIVLTSFIVVSIHSITMSKDILMYDIFLLFEVIIVPYAFYRLFVHKFKFQIDILLFKNAFIAGLITVVLLINPAWAEIMKTQILRIPDLLLTNFYFRGFGFSDGLTFAYPVVQGFCASFIIAGMIHVKPVYYLALLPIFTSVFVNARSGLIPIFIASIIVLIHSSIATKLKIISICITLLMLGSFALNSSEDNQLAESVKWGLSTFAIIGDILQGKEAENTEALFHDMVQFPDNIADWLLGTGRNIYQTYYGNYSTSDIGFCIRTVYGGIIYMFFWFGLWITMFRRCKRHNRTLAYIMFGSLLYLNWKGDFFVVNPSCRFFFFVYVLCILDSSFLNHKLLVCKKSI